MELIIQSSKELKEVKQFIKSLNYVYDSITLKEKIVFLYISEAYIAICNNFNEAGRTVDFSVCFCKMKKHMYKLKNFSSQNNQDGLIYQLDADLMTKLLNSQIQPDITQLILTFPQLDSHYEATEMNLSYEADGVFFNARLFTKLQQVQWPFPKGHIDQQYLENSTINNFLIFPPKFMKDIQYAKKFEDFWFCVHPNGVNIKKTIGSCVVFDHLIMKSLFGNYNFVQLKQVLCGNVYLCLNSHVFFHHLSLSNKQNQKTEAKIVIQQEYYQEDQLVKASYLYLTTVTQKKQVHEMFVISSRADIDYHSKAQVAVPRLQKPMIRDTKKEEELDEERLVLNRFYGPDQGETNRMDMIMREGLIKQTEAKGEDSRTYSMIPKKYKVQM